MGGVDHDDVLELGEVGEERFVFRIVRDVDIGGSAGHHPAARPEVVSVSHDLEWFDREHHVGLAGWDDVGPDLRVAVAEIRLHSAATLGHAVDLGLLEFKAGVESGVVNDERDGQDALATDPGENDVLFHRLSVLSATWS